MLKSEQKIAYLKGVIFSLIYTPQRLGQTA